MIAGNDAEKIVSLERGTVRVYWEVAIGYIRRLLAEQDRVNKAKNHGRKR